MLQAIGNRLSKFHLIFRSSLIIFLFFWLRIFLGCVPPEPEDFFYNGIYLEGLDNSGALYRYTPPDTMYSEAVAFELTVYDSADYDKRWYAEALQNLGFQQALAFSVYREYNPLNKIDRIRIYTLNPLNNNYAAGDGITDSVLFYPNNGFSVYSPLEKAVRHLNQIQSDLHSSVRLIVKPAVLNTTAKFRVSVLFENGLTLTDTTKTFTIITPE